MIRGLSDALLPVAREQIESAYKDVLKNEKSFFIDLFIKNNEKKTEKKIVEVYENYTAAFGMIVNQSGFQTAIAIYSEQKAQSEGSRRIVLQLMFEILNSKELLQEKDLDSFRRNVLFGNHYNDNYEELFKEASIALKRAIRTYEIVKKQNDHGTE